MTELPKFIVPERPNAPKSGRTKRLLKLLTAPVSANAALIAVVLSLTASGSTMAFGNAGSFAAGALRTAAGLENVPQDIAAGFQDVQSGALAPLNSVSASTSYIFRGEVAQLNTVSAQLAVSLRQDQATTMSALADAAQPFLVAVPDYSLINLAHNVGIGPGNQALAFEQTAAPSLPQVLGASINTKPQAPDPTASRSYIQNLIDQTFQRLLSTGALIGPQGPQGSAGASGIVQNGSGESTVEVGSAPIVTYVPADPASGFTGASIAGFTQLSSQDLAAQTITDSGVLAVQGAATLDSGLSVTGNAAVSGALSAGTSTLNSLTVSGPATFNGSTTIAGLTVTGLNPGLKLGSVAFQGAAGLSQDNANFFYNSTTHSLGLGTSTPLQTLTLQGNGTQDILNVASSSGLSDFYVASSGNIGIGTTTPSDTLQVVGGITNIYPISGGSLTPHLVSSVSLGINDPGRFALSGQYAYVVSSNQSPAVLTMPVVDLSNPLNPTVVNTSSISDGSVLGSPFYIVAAGKYLYITNDDGGSGVLQTYDTSNASAPSYVGNGGYANGVYVPPCNVNEATNGWDSSGVYVSGRYAFVSRNSGCEPVLQIMDIGNPSSPARDGYIFNQATSTDVSVAGHYAYITTGNGMLEAFDFSNPMAPVQVSTTKVGSNLSKLYISGRYAYITDS